MSLSLNTEPGPSQKLAQSIEKVVIIKGTISSDPTIWEIHISGKVLKIDSENIERVTAFRKQYIKVFNAPAPLITPVDWLIIITAMSEIAEIVTAGEESERVYIAYQVFEKVCELQVTDDRGIAAAGKGMLDYHGYFCVTSKKIEDIVLNAGYRITFNSLSETMTELGLKKEGTENVWLGKSVRSWLFVKFKVLEQKKEVE